MNIRDGLPAWLIVVIALACGLAAPRPAWTQPPTVSVYPESLEVAHGSTFTLDIVVPSDMTDVLGWDIAVTFDGSVILLQSVTEGSLPTTSGYETFFSWLNPPPPADSVRVNGAILGHSVDGPGALFTLEFLGYAPSTLKMTDVTITVSTIRDGVNHDIVHDVVNGRVTVTPPIAAERVSWGRVKSIYGGDSP